MASMSFSSAPRRAPTSMPNSAPSDSAPRRTGWGTGNSSRADFDPAAAAAFGKKPLVSALNGILPDDRLPKEKQWAKSALQQQREAAKAEAAKKAAPPPKTYDEEFPTLGGAGGASKAPKPVISGGSDTKKPTPSTSFAALAANWARADEDRKYMEALAAKKRAEQLTLQEYENADRMRYYRNLNANRAHDTGYDGYYEDEDNEYIEGELDEMDYSAADLRAEKRAIQRRYEEHYSDQDDEEEHDY